MTYRARSVRIITVLLLFFWHLTSFGQHKSLQNAYKKTIIRYFDEVINSRNLNRMGQFFSKDYIWHQMNEIDVHSSQDSSHVSTLRWLYIAIPDVHYTIDNAIVRETSLQ